ncbi:MAG: cell division protein ZapA [Halioglobus sp.]|nr:cell division protein ZapA [Halioglobus sp.]
MSIPNTMTVKILDKDYQVTCPEEREAELLVSAKYLDKQMRGIRDTGKVIGLERIAVMAALNISHELLQPDQETDVDTTAGDSVKRLSSKLDSALQELRQLKIG